MAGKATNLEISVAKEESPEGAAEEENGAEKRFRGKVGSPPSSSTSPSREINKPGLGKRLVHTFFSPGKRRAGFHARALRHANNAAGLELLTEAA